MSKYLIIGLLIAVIGVLELRGRSSHVVAMISFLASFALVIFREQGLLLSTGVILLFWTGVLTLVRASLTRRSPLGESTFPFVSLCIFLTILGLAIGLYRFGYRYSYFSEQSLLELFSVSTFPAVAAVFVAKAYPHFSSTADRHLILQAFIASVYVQFLVVLLQLLGLSGMLPTFFQGSVAIVGEAALGRTARYGGLLGDYELIVDYCIVTIGMAIVLAQSARSIVFPGMAIVFGIALALISGTRSFVVVLAIALILFSAIALVRMRKGRTRIRIAAGVIALVPASILATYYAFPDMLVFQRLGVTVSKLMSDPSVGSTLNRNFSGSISLLWDEVGALGAGAFLLPDIKGNEIVSHNVVLALYARYGVLGFVVFCSFVLVLCMRLWRSLKYAANDARVFELAILTAFSAALLMQQMKVSGLRSSASILIYSAWFALVFARTSNRRQSVLMSTSFTR